MHIKFYILLFLALVYIIVCFVRERGYYILFPSQNLFFPIPSRKEVTIVKHMYNGRTKNDIMNYELTDLNAANLFHGMLGPHGVTKKEIEKVLYDQHLMSLIYATKYIFNRVRPFQLDKTIIPPKNSHTYFTPSYPAGHVAQFYSVYKYFSPKYPELSEQMLTLVDIVDKARVRAGIHYPSDGILSRQLVDYLYST